MRLYLLGIAAAALVLLTSFVLREKNRAELQLQQQNDALAATAQSVDAELSGCCSTIAQFITNPDPKKYASATERDLQAEVELTYYIYLSTENNPDLVNYYLYYPDANVILSAHSAARAAQNSSFYAAVQAYTSQETAIYTLDVDGRIGFLFPFDSHFYIAYERMRSAPALVFAELDLNTIFSVLPESLQSGRNALYIMDPAGAVIYENTSNRLQTLLSDGMQRLVLSGQGQHICQSVSSLTGWTFYHTTPAATGMQIFCNALVASLPFLLCLLGLAVLVYLLFKRQVIQPLQGILQQTPVELPQQTENELALLCHAREQLVQQTNSHASMLARMRLEILNQTFSRLLRSDAFDPTETQTLLSDLGCI
jgi:type II secretory pathway pseudopilin PulG